MLSLSFGALRPVASFSLPSTQSFPWIFSCVFAVSHGHECSLGWLERKDRRVKEKEKERESIITIRLLQFRYVERARGIIAARLKIKGTSVSSDISTLLSFRPIFSPHFPSSFILLTNIYFVLVFIYFFTHHSSFPKLYFDIHCFVLIRFNLSRINSSFYHWNYVLSISSELFLELLNYPMMENNKSINQLLIQFIIKSPWLSLSLPVSPCLSLSLPVFPCLSLSLPVSPCLSLSLPISLCLSLSLPVSLCLSLSLPVSSYLSLPFSSFCWFPFISACLFVLLSISP